MFICPDSWVSDFCGQCLVRPDILPPGKHIFACLEPLKLMKAVESIDPGLLRALGQQTDSLIDKSANSQASDAAGCGYAGLEANFSGSQWFDQFGAIEEDKLASILDEISSESLAINAQEATAVVPNISQTRNLLWPSSSFTGEQQLTSNGDTEIQETIVSEGVEDSISNTSTSSAQGNRNLVCLTCQKSFGRASDRRLVSTLYTFPIEMTTGLRFGSESI